MQEPAELNWNPLIDAAVEVCRQGIRSGQSPFGAVIARPDGTIVATAHNTVRSTCDATAHAEINAIRRACKVTGSIHLDGCIMFSTCEPCPMCAAAIHWSRIATLAFGASIADAESAGFNELSFACSELYRIGGSTVRLLDPMARESCARLFREWLEGPAANPY